MTIKDVYIGGAGKGGAGLLTCLKALGYAASAKGLQISYAPSYAPATRGGLVEGSLVISNNIITSPIVHKFSLVIAFDIDAYNSYGKKLQKNGIIIWDSSKIETPPHLPIEDILSYGIPLFAIAESANFPRLANMVMLGSVCRILNLFSIDELIDGMIEYLPPWRQKLISSNKIVLEKTFSTDFQKYKL